MPPTIRILVIDDHGLFRQGLVRLLQSEAGFVVVGECATLDQASLALTGVAPDLVLLDVDLAGRHAGELLEKLPPNSPPKVLLVTAAAGGQDVARLLAMGADGAISKTANADQLLLAIRRVMQGERWVDPAFLDCFISAAAHAETPQPRVSVSGREGEVLALVCQGLRNKEIALEMGVTEPAIKASIQRLFQKFGAANRAQLVSIAANRKSAGRHAGNA